MSNFDKYKLYYGKNDPEFDTCAPYLLYKSEYGGEAITDDNPDPSLEELANFMDQNAESRNNHDFVTAHRLLAAMIHKHAGREKATAILRDLAEHGGLDSASGCYPGPSAFDEYGLPDDWSDWSLPE